MTTIQFIERAAADNGLPYAELPRYTVDTTYSLPGGTQYTPVNSAAFTSNLASSASVDNPVIILAAGTTYTGNYTLPARTGSGWCYIISSALASLPASGVRVAPSDASNMPTVQASVGDCAFKTTAASVGKYRLVGLRCLAPATLLQNAVINIGNGESSEASLPADIIIDRCVIKGDTTNGVRRGVALNGKRCAVVDSYIYDIKEVTADTQAVWAYNTPGPLKIHNNYLEAAGENFMVGGATVPITNLIVSDVTFTQNYVYKPTSWTGGSFTVKNHLELKAGVRVLILGNVFENIWAEDQNGDSILVSPKSTNSWNTASDVTVSYNKFVNCAQGILIGGTDVGTMVPGKRFLIEHNELVVNGTSTYVMQVLENPETTTIRHNTALITVSGGRAIWCYSTIEAAGFTVENNIMSAGDYGIAGSGTAEGTATLDAYFTGYSVTNNAIIGSSNTGSYPAGNFFPANTAAVNFENYAGGDYRLAAGSSYKAGAANDASDGTDMGANIVAVEAYATIAVQGYT